MVAAEIFFVVILSLSEPVINFRAVGVASANCARRGGIRRTVAGPPPRMTTAICVAPEGLPIVLIFRCRSSLTLPVCVTPRS